MRDANWDKPKSDTGEQEKVAERQDVVVEGEKDVEGEAAGEGHAVSRYRSEPPEPVKALLRQLPVGGCRRFRRDAQAAGREGYRERRPISFV